MCRKNISKSIRLLSLFVFFPVLVFAQDIRNSQDHQLISRYPGQVIYGFE